MQRLEAHDFPHPMVHLSYPHAGHSIGPPYRPTTALEAVHPVNRMLMHLGGTPEGNAFACRDSWQEVLEFLQNL